MTLYLATSSSDGIADAIAAGLIGRLCTPDSRNLPREGIWAADSGCYTKGDRFDLDRYLAWLTRMRPYAERCLFAPAPDVVGDWPATLARSLPVLSQLRYRGYRAALVLQDGATVDTVPWDALDVLFVGGGTEWKLGPQARAICEEAHVRGVFVHVGRVNGGRRYRYVRDVLKAGSADGTYLSFGPDVNLPKLLAWGTTPARASA